MTRPTLIQNLTAALVATVLTLLVKPFLHAAFSGPVAVKLTLALTTVLYAAYWLHHSRARAGKILALLTLMLAVPGALLLNTVTSQLIVLVTTLWGIRCLLYYSSPLSGLADLSLCLISLAGAYQAYVTSHSWVTAIWIFFLLQSLQALIPKRLGHRKAASSGPADDRFNRAHAEAEAAIRQLSKGL